MSHMTHMDINQDGVPEVPEVKEFYSKSQKLSNMAPFQALSTGFFVFVARMVSPGNPSLSGEGA